VTIESLLAEHVAEATFDTLPKSSVEAARRSLVDTVMVACGAARTPGMKEATRAALSGADGNVSIWHTGQTSSARAAVFLNGLAAAALDYDSIYPDAAVHPDLIAVPVALSLCEARDGTGRDLLCAIALGGDLMCRLALATRANTGWFYTSLYGAVVSAAVTAHLLKCKAPEVMHAMGLGAMNAAGTYQPVKERSLSKRTLAAFAADSGVLCGQIAAEGYPGPSQWLLGQFGMHSMYEAGDSDTIVRNLGTVFENERISLKPYPSCQCNHAAIDALLELRAEHSLVAEDVQSIEAIISPYMFTLVGAPYAPGMTPQVAAQFSIQYSLARALLDGEFGIAAIQDAAASDPRAIELTSRIRVTVDPDNPGNYNPAVVRLTLRNGTVLAQENTVLRGSVDSPLTSNQLNAKAYDCLMAGGYKINHAVAGAIVDSLLNVEQESSVSGFMTQIRSTLRGMSSSAE